MRIEVKLDMDDLPYELADQCSHATLTRLILAIDENVCEQSFTENLIIQLQAALNEEERADGPI